MEDLKIKREIRCFFGDEHYFCIIDVLKFFVECEDYELYWNELHKKMLDEKSNINEICKKVRVISKNNDVYYLDVINLAGIMRIIQSISTEKADVLKVWLANLAMERFEEIVTPELVVERAVDYYIKKDKTLNELLSDVEEIYTLSVDINEECEEFIADEKIVGIDDIIFNIFVSKDN